MCWGAGLQASCMPRKCVDSCCRWVLGAEGCGVAHSSCFLHHRTSASAMIRLSSSSTACDTYAFFLISVSCL